MIVEAEPSALPGKLIRAAIENAIKFPAITLVPIPATNIWVNNRPLVNNTDSTLAGIPIPMTSQIMLKFSGLK
ncbi:Uncharacterised protein [Shigella sonnei]|nr:Uncharacterised protein [Shigella sonnei]CSP98589.1 Uncharacterised protein [Shigella sonnei]CST39610.1 Uncharacterised protein [Shigella sonnei]